MCAESTESSRADSWSCEGDPIDELKQMFVDIVQKRRIVLGQSPAKRPVFLKPHGVASGTFEICEDLPENLRAGVFALDKLSAWVRFSSDTLPSRSDLQTTCGVGIKLFDVAGQKLLAVEGRGQLDELNRAVRVREDLLDVPGVKGRRGRGCAEGRDRQAGQK